MNNKVDEWIMTATFDDPERRDFWHKALGTSEIPIVSIVPRICALPGLEPRYCVFLDLGALSQDKFVQLTRALADQLDLPPDDVAKGLLQEGLPLNCEGAIIWCTHGYFALKMSPALDGRPNGKVTLVKLFEHLTPSQMSQAMALCPGAGPGQFIAFNLAPNGNIDSWFLIDEAERRRLTAPEREDGWHDGTD